MQQQMVPLSAWDKAPAPAAPPARPAPPADAEADADGEANPDDEKAFVKFLLARAMKDAA